MGFAFLDVAIGMTFIFLMLSLICSAINELIAALLKARAGFLEKGIIRLLENEAFVEKLYKHPLIHNLGGDVRPWLQKLGIKDRPAYIPARNFALALMDMVQPGIGTRNAVVASSSTGLRIGTPRTGAHFAAALAADPAHVPATVRRALVTLVQAAGEDAVATRQNIEAWYNSTMDRVSGAYKRRTQFAIFFIGIIVTVGVNADSVILVKRLTSDKTLSASIADSAQQYTRNKDSVSITNKEDGYDSDKQVAEAKEKLRDNLAMLDRLGLPIGWDGEDKTTRPPAWPGLRNLLAAWPVSRELLVTHWAGWLLTAFAVSFGAPFWFDLLNRFMVVRSTVKPQEKSQTETSKD